ncbi:MAG: WYL domain-containing protein [Firmicutes bacterium]|nr:WYL domain-containing protein [Bacillota bacterium]
MIFSELYSVYYNTVAKIIEVAFEADRKERDLQKVVEEKAFSESVTTILPALKSGRWPLLNQDLSPNLKHKPALSITTLEKRWLKALSEDPRIQLFGIDFPKLDDVEPLFTQEDYRIFDQYADGDPFTDENYIKHFRLIQSAIKKNLPVEITMTNKYGKKVWVRFYPKGFEYSVKDDKIRIVAEGCRFKHFNLGRVLSCEYYSGQGSWNEEIQADPIKELVLLIHNERNALERAMLHFAHFEKQAERLNDDDYILRLKYYGNDETEMVIRVLSFGPYVKVLEPQSFVDLIKERLLLQKSCEFD